MKATTVVFSSEVCGTFTAISSRTLLSEHVKLLGGCNGIYQAIETPCIPAVR